MADTTKLDERGQETPEAQEPGIGAKKEEAASAAETPTTSEMQEAGPFAEASPQGEESPETFEHGSGPKLDEPATNNPSGTEDASAPMEAAEMPEETGDLENDATREPGGAADFSGDGENFFAGWDGLGEEPLAGEQELLDQLREESLTEAGGDFPDSPLSGMSLAAALQSFDASPGFDSKHDGLADAVQAALFSLYGDQPSESTGANPASLAFSPELNASGADWTSLQEAAPGKDLSPQDVILNYFNYEPDAPREGLHPEAASNGHAAHYMGDTGVAMAQPGEHAGYESQWSAAYAAPVPYSAPDGYPESSELAPTERQGSRVLRAAAIGLVGGIVVAASLAVLVISGYGPDVRSGPGLTTQASDAEDEGYDSRLRAEEDSDPSKSAAPESAAEAPSLAAADIVAIPGQPSPLSIDLKTQQAAGQALVSITGVPEGARLNAGVDAGGGNWLLPPARLKGLTINLPASAGETVSLGVQLVDSNVRTPLSEQKHFAIRVMAKAEPAAPAAASQTNASGRPAAEMARHAQPVAAAAPVEAPPPVAAAAPVASAAPAAPQPPLFTTQTVPVVTAANTPQPQIQAQSPGEHSKTPAAIAPRQPNPAAPPMQAKGASQAEMQDLIREGNKRMREGDILEARQLYQKAVSLGDPEAALAMGRSYDPVYFARIEKKNAEPDASKAFDWYRKAMDAGAGQTAKVRIDNLKHYLNE